MVQEGQGAISIIISIIIISISNENSMKMLQVLNGLAVNPITLLNGPGHPQQLVRLVDDDGEGALQAADTITITISIVGNSHRNR